MVWCLLWGVLFTATLALDIVYDALTDAEIAACENIISSKIAPVSKDGSWADARRGGHGTWNIYKGKRTTPDNDYYEGIMIQVTPEPLLLLLLLMVGHV